MELPWDTTQILTAGALALMLLGVTGIVLSRHLLRMVFGLALLEAGVSLLLVVVGFRPDAVAPILRGELSVPMVDPVPQALVLTAIVIGLGVQALALALLLRIHRAYGSLEMREVRNQMEREIAAEFGSAMPGSDRAPVLPAKQVTER